MNVLVIGSGGREHALVWKIKQNRWVRQIFCAPGNAGIAELAQCVDIEPTDISRLLKFAKDNRIGLTVVGPEAPLVAGIVNQFEKEALRIFGPSKEAAQLEGSKVFAKEFMRRHQIPTGGFDIFDTRTRAQPFLRALLNRMASPAVIKADGLASGKGVIIGYSLEEADEILEQILEKRIFKEAGSRVVIEEYLRGDEISVLAICDGNHFVLLDPCEDHKRIFDGDQGPNTGGMGACSPVPWLSSELLKEIASRIIAPTLKGMKEEGYPFKGVLYVGLMMTKDGPFVLEYNVRFGDPETQSLLPRLKTDLVALMMASCQGRLGWWSPPQWDERPCVCVVMSSGGYPGAYETGKEITGLEALKNQKDLVVFHAGTKKSDGKIVSAGGRVLGVTALGRDLCEARENTYKAVQKIHFEKCFFRGDIGQRILEEDARRKEEAEKKVLMEAYLKQEGLKD